jgi:hypothetical protein
VNLLDENIPASQRRLLLSSRVRVRQIGLDVGRAGMQDDEIIAFLQHLRRPTFFTRDGDFFDRRLCHARYCLVFMAVERHEVALFARRLLRHADFDTQAKRMGAVVRVSGAGLSAWRLHAKKPSAFDWK